MTNPNLIKTTASTMQKVANLHRYRHPADLVNIDIRPIRQQRLQINGELPFGAKLYHSEAQQNLVKQLTQSRNLFRTSSLEDRIKIATSQFNLWSQYLNLLVSRIPKSDLLDGEKRQKVYQSYLIAKERNQQRMQLGKTVRLFYHIAQGFRFDVPIHPLVMMRMVNPDLGYLNNFKDQRLNFDDYLKFLEEMISVSKLFSEGSTLHGSQLLSFVFWKAYTNQPTMKTDQFCKFLTLFKFNNIKAQNMQNQLQYHLKSREGELIKSSPIRFDLWRNIFLERGL